MTHQDDYEARCATGIDASTMALIRPTDIMLGRGPKCYNNSGNRVLRKLIKEHVVHYKSKASRREKAALVKLLISKLQVNGYRFLHLSPSGTWIEAPLHVAEKKVGHGLRDARLSVTRNTGDDNILPKNFRPSHTESTNNKDQVEPVLSWEANIKEETRTNESDVKEADTTGAGPQQCNAFPTTPQKCAYNVVTSSSARAVQRVQASQFAFQGKEQLLIHTNSVQQEYPSVQERRENGKFAFLDCDIEEDIDRWDRGGDVNCKTEGWPHGSKSSSYPEAERRPGNWGHYWEAIKNTTSLPYVTPSMGDPHDAHSLNAVDMALNMYAPAYGRTFDNLFDDDQFQPMGCAVEDAQSLCQWFSSNLA